jgi:hypothetical protein
LDDQAGSAGPRNPFSWRAQRLAAQSLRKRYRDQNSETIRSRPNSMLSRETAEAAETTVDEAALEKAVTRKEEAMARKETEAQVESNR